jgi:hypothetical protein
MTIRRKRRRSCVGTSRVAFVGLGPSVHLLMGSRNFGLIWNDLRSTRRRCAGFGQARAKTVRSAAGLTETTSFARQPLRLLLLRFRVLCRMMVETCTECRCFLQAAVMFPDHRKICSQATGMANITPSSIGTLLHMLLSCLAGRCHLFCLRRCMQPL